MYSASCNQSMVRDGADYEEVYPSGHKDQENPSEERSPSTSSPSSTNEVMEIVELEEGSDDGEEQPIKSVEGTSGLREFVMLSEWTMNDFNSTIKEKHFSTLRANYQIPDNIPICLLYKLEKCSYEGVEGVGVYE